MAKIESVYLPDKSMAGASVGVGGGKQKSPSSKSSPSSSEDLRCSFCSKHFTRKLDLAHHLESMHCRERCLYGKCGAVFTGKDNCLENIAKNSISTEKDDLMCNQHIILQFRQTKHRLPHRVVAFAPFTLQAMQNVRRQCRHRDRAPQPHLGRAPGTSFHAIFNLEIITL